jgi:hypothetical protein
LKANLDLSVVCKPILQSRSFFRSHRR